MKKIKIGVFGAGRGTDIAKNFLMLGCDVVALCDSHPNRQKAGANRTVSGLKLYDNFDEFIEHDMDAVIIANNFHEHAPYVIKCFEKNLHVFCECISNGTMAEGVELIRAFEKSKSIFMLAENYPQMIFNREIARVVKSGKLGKILYAEGEYNHPDEPHNVIFKKIFNYYPLHWRNYLPSSYYITHSLGPCMAATGATPKRVVAFNSFAPHGDDEAVATHNADRAAIITTQNDDGSVFRVTGCAGFGAHHNSYRVCGTKGQIENLRGMGDKLMLRYNYWQIPEGEKETQLYDPDWNDKDEDIIKTSGHGGADYLTARIFVDCIKANKQPEHPFDIYSSLAMSSVAILAHRSMLDGGKPYDIPDFHLEKARKQYEKDYATPFYGQNGEAPDLPCCSHKDYAPSEKQLKLYHAALASDEGGDMLI